MNWDITYTWNGRQYMATFTDDIENYDLDDIIVFGMGDTRQEALADLVYDYIESEGYDAYTPCFEQWADALYSEEFACDMRPRQAWALLGGMSAKRFWAIEDGRAA